MIFYVLILVKERGGGALMHVYLWEHIVRFYETWKG